MYDWLSTQIGADAASVASYLVMAASLCVIAWICLAFLRRLHRGNFIFPGRKRNQRLSVRGAAAIDSRRRLVLVRRDDIEHLLLVGGPADVIVESNIPAFGPKTLKMPQPTQNAEAKADTVARIEEKNRVDAVALPAADDHKTGEDINHQPEAVFEQSAPPPVAAAMPAQTESGQPGQQHQQSNGTPQTAMNRRPPAPQVHINTHHSPYLAGARPAAHKASVNQVPPQHSPHQGMPITAPAHAAPRPQQPSVRQAPINGQNGTNGTAQPIRQPAPGVQRQGAVPYANGTTAQAPIQQRHRPQQPASNGTTAAMPRHNGANGQDGHAMMGDLSDISPSLSPTHKPLVTPKEAAQHIAARKQEPGFSQQARPGEEDFDKVLQEELLRSQHSAKRASSNKN